jgi:hypothetical protein
MSNNYLLKAPIDNWNNHFTPFLDMSHKSEEESTPMLMTGKSNTGAVK